MSKLFKGFGVYPALTVGKSFIYEKFDLEDMAKEASKRKLSADDLEKAIERTRAELEELHKSLSEKGSEQLSEIIDFQLLLLEDETFIGKIRDSVKSGENPGQAILKTVNEVKAMFESMDNIYMRERASDIVDLGARLLKNLLGLRGLEIEQGTIVVTDELSPSEVVMIADKVAGIVTERGTTLSHFAIIARELGIPTVVNVRGILRNVHEGEILAVNGLAGQVVVSPTEEERLKFEKMKESWDRELKNIIAKSREPAILKDGETVVKVVANLGRVEEAETAAYYGAEGVGLFRTEFFFLGRDSPPTEDEQYNGFKFVVNRLSPGSVFIRTLDIGSDKQISYIPLPQEPNPALGKRAIRLYPEEIKKIIIDQIKAILRAAKEGDVGIMFPMVADISEIEYGKKLVKEAKEILEDEGKEYGEAKIGIMIEIPSAALLADRLAPHVDFMSIGTNDLTQYTLAVDRAGIYAPTFFDHLHPAVLRLVKHTVEAIKGTKVELSVCGESASDIYTIPLLIGLGIRKLSSAPLVIPVVKYLIRQFNLEDLEELAEKAIKETSPSNVRELVKEFYKKSAITLPIM